MRTAEPGSGASVRLKGFLFRQRHIMSNAGWMLADRGIRMVGGLVIGVWVTRYLGPGKFGLLNYAVAFVTLFSALATLGLDRLVVKELVLRPTERPEILGTAFGLKFIGGAAGWALSVASVHVLRHDWGVTRIVAIVAGTALTQSADVVDFWFQSQIQSKFSVLARNSAFVVFSLTKAGLVLAHAPLYAFALVVIGENAMAAIILLFLYSRQDGNPFVWRFRRTLASRLLSESWPLLLAYMAYLVYARIDQIMIGSMVGDAKLGIYMAAAKVSEIPVALLIIMGSTVFPKLVDLYEKDKAAFLRWYESLTGGLTWASVLMLIFLWIFGAFLVHVLFGSQFRESANVLVFQAVGLVFMFNGGLRSAFLTITGNQKILSVTTVISALINVGLNYALIPRYGIYGAAGAGVLVQATSLYLLNASYRATWPIFLIQSRGFLLFPFLWKSVKGK